MEHNINLKKLL